MDALTPAGLAARTAGLGVLLGCALLAACSGTSSTRAAPLRQGEDSGVAPRFADGGPDAGGRSSPSTQPGSPCPQRGQTLACWTGPASMRDVGACHDGVQTCAATGELSTWSPCTGEELACGDAGSVDAAILDSGGDVGTFDAGMCTILQGGTGSAGGLTQAPACAPGSSRWCDDGSCYWGQQQCQSDGTWGDCNDTLDNAGPPACPAGSIEYDENCCVQSGQCCAHAVDGNNFGSVGSCAQVDPCACHELCAQGATRWCQVPDGNDDGSGAWGQQACGADGTWETCAASSSAPSSCASGGDFDQDCCIASGECCEAFDSEGSDPISFNCPATACSAEWASAGDNDGGDYTGGAGDGSDPPPGPGFSRPRTRTMRRAGGPANRH